MPLNLPVQGAVNRSVPYEVALPRETRIPEDVDLPVEEILLNEVGGSFGSMPGDPPSWSRRVDTGYAYCQLLSGYAGALCMARRR